MNNKVKKELVLCNVSIIIFEQIFIMKRFLASFVLLLLVGFHSNAQDQKFKVVLDVGHGTIDKGATNGVQSEHELMMDLATAISKIDLKDVEVVLYKAGKSESLQDRVQAINAMNAHLVLSMHMGAKREENGQVRLYIPLSTIKNEGSMDYAASLSWHLTQGSYFNDITIKPRERGYLIQRIDAPVIEVELGSIDAQRDVAYLKSAGGLNVMATVFESFLNALTK